MRQASERASNWVNLAHGDIVKLFGRKRRAEGVPKRPKVPAGRENITVHLSETLSAPRILSAEGHHDPMEFAVNKVMPVVFALIPLAAVLGACVSTF